MEKQMRRDARFIVEEAIRRVMPDAAVRRALEGRTFPGRIVIVAVGKAAWRMAAAASSLRNTVTVWGISRAVNALRPDIRCRMRIPSALPGGPWRQSGT